MKTKRALRSVCLTESAPCTSMSSRQILPAVLTSYEPTGAYVNCASACVQCSQGGSTKTDQHLHRSNRSAIYVGVHAGVLDKFTLGDRNLHVGLGNKMIMHTVLQYTASSRQANSVVSGTTVEAAPSLQDVVRALYGSRRSQTGRDIRPAVT